MKVRILFAGVLASLLSTAAMAQVDGITVGPAGATFNDPITITVYPDQTCPLPSADPNKSLSGASIIRIHGGVTLGTTAWQNVVDAGNGATDAITGFTQDPVTGYWSKTITPNAYWTGTGGAPLIGVTGLNFVLNGGPAGTQWDKEGKGSTPAGGTACADYAVVLPLSGPITEIPNNILSARGKMIKTIAPNPVVGATTIKYMLAKTGNVSVKVYNAIGTEVATLVQENQEAGDHSITWNANVTAGIYHVSVSANGLSDAMKVIVK